MNETFCMAHKNLHTKPCVFTAPDAHSAYIQAERLNGVLLDALGEDVPEGGRDIPEGSLGASHRLRIPGPGRSRASRRDLAADLRRREGVSLCLWRRSER